MTKILNYKNIVTNVMVDESESIEQLNEWRNILINDKLIEEEKLNKVRKYNDKSRYERISKRLKMINIFLSIIKIRIKILSKQRSKPMVDFNQLSVKEMKTRTKILLNNSIRKQTRKKHVNDLIITEILLSLDGLIPNDQIDKIYNTAKDKAHAKFSEYVKNIKNGDKIFEKVTQITDVAFTELDILVDSTHHEYKLENPQY